jgi:hypothetical protein
MANSLLADDETTLSHLLPTQTAIDRIAFVGETVLWEARRGDSFGHDPHTQCIFASCPRHIANGMCRVPYNHKL